MFDNVDSVTPKMSSYSIVEYFSSHDNYRCGYCGNTDTNCSHGMWCHQMTVQDYQDLIDRGWRRSGCYAYKPTMNKTCCPQYTIKCAALDFKLTKSHKKAIKRVNNFLNYGTRPAERAPPSNAEGGGEELREESVNQPTDLSGCSLTSGDSDSATPAERNNPEEMKASAEKVTPEKNQETEPEAKAEPKPAKTIKPGVGADPNKPKCKKAKELRRELWEQKHGKPKEVSPSKKSKSEPKSLDDYLNETVDNPAHKLELRLVRSKPRSRLFGESFMEAYKVYQHYQTVVHKDKPDDCDLSSYKSFLVDSPLQEEEESEDFEGFGSFHHQYLLDGKIIAVGVLDLLPSCVSSVYLFYDPDYWFLSLGTYSALREVQLTQRLHSVKPSLKYYYMGFYVHSCPKMNYKAKFGPAYLACPKSFSWHPVEECQKQLDQDKYSEFNPKGEAPAKMKKLRILHQRQVMSYSQYQAIAKPQDEEVQKVQEYADLVGERVASRMLLFRK